VVCSGVVLTGVFYPIFTGSYNLKVLMETGDDAIMNINIIRPNPGGIVEYLERIEAADPVRVMFEHDFGRACIVAVHHAVNIIFFDFGG
jgi:hypothetical protein